MIGERVRLARDYLQISQKELAATADVSQSAISQIEKGGKVSDGTLQSISDATGYSMRFFQSGALPDLPELSMRFRRSASTRRRDEKRLRAHVRQGLELVTDLERQAELPSVRIEPTHDPGIDDDAIEEIALETRRHLGIGPADPVPNLMRAVERAGVVVFGGTAEVDGHEAVSAWPLYPAGRPVVCYTRGKPGDRQRLSIAHEIGHLVLHQLRAVESERAETEAFRFGAALLLPRKAAVEEIEPPVTLRTLAWTKARWGVSIGALIMRCRDLRIIDQRRSTSLHIQLGTRGWKKSEPVEVPTERPTLLSQALRLVHGTDQPSRVASLTGLTPLAVRDLIADDVPAERTSQTDGSQTQTGGQVIELGDRTPTAPGTSGDMR